jgi:hypothetical protein
MTVHRGEGEHWSEMRWLLGGARGVGAPDRLWAAIRLALHASICRAILARLPVRAGNLEACFYRGALRGRPLPDLATYVLVTDDLFEAVHEVGSLSDTWNDVPARLRPQATT